ncbi:hypothetical protein ANO14919_134930 [Xylariales sp. No.14919]|nr:hypothetical protein ANO14919_134930 [Xylariales sp. No.14919]
MIILEAALWSRVRKNIYRSYIQGSEVLLYLWGPGKRAMTIIAPPSLLYSARSITTAQKLHPTHRESRITGDKTNYEPLEDSVKGSAKGSQSRRMLIKTTSHRPLQVRKPHFVIPTVPV